MTRRDPIVEARRDHPRGHRTYGSSGTSVDAERERGEAAMAYRRSAFVFVTIDSREDSLDAVREAAVRGDHSRSFRGAVRVKEGLHGRDRRFDAVAQGRELLAHDPAEILHRRDPQRLARADGDGGGPPDGEGAAPRHGAARGRVGHELDLAPGDLDEGVIHHVARRPALHAVADVRGTLAHELGGFVHAEDGGVLHAGRHRARAPLVLAEAHPRAEGGGTDEVRVARAHALDDVPGEERTVELARHASLRHGLGKADAVRHHLRQRGGRDPARGRGGGDAVEATARLELLDVRHDVALLLELEEPVLLRLAHGVERVGHGWNGDTWSETREIREGARYA